MPKPRIFKVESISAFATQIQKQLEAARKRSPNVPATMNWYRGHSSSSGYSLKPSLYRHKTITGVADLLKLEEKMMWEFKRQAMLHSYKGDAEDPLHRTELLFYMQHHGVPTRLLDWTSNPFIALYFALSRAKKDRETGQYKDAAAVWILDPYSWNRFALREMKWEDTGPANPEDHRIKTYLPAPSTSAPVGRRYELPIALVGSVNTPRMMAQRGHFAMFSLDTRPMEQIYSGGKFEAGCLVKLEVPSVCVGGLLRDLIALGYTDSVAYPDLEGLAMEVKRLHGFDL